MIFEYLRNTKTKVGQYKEVQKDLEEIPNIDKQTIKDRNKCRKVIRTI